MLMRTQDRFRHTMLDRNGRSRKQPFVLLLILLGALFQSGCQSTDVRDSGFDEDEPNRLAQLQTQLGVGYMRAGKDDLAWDRLHRAVEADPRYAPAHNALGLIYDKRNEPENAEKHYLRAVELNPADPAALNNYGLFLCRRERYKEAEEYFRQARENPRNKNPESAYYNAGQCLLLSGNLEEAEGSLRSALQLDPKLPGALISMAELSFKRDRPLAARGYLQRYLEVKSHTPRSLWLGIQVEQALGDKDTVSSYAMLLKSNYPDSFETQMLYESEVQ